MQLSSWRICKELLLLSSHWFQWEVSYTVLLVRSFSYTPDASFSKESSYGAHASFSEQFLFKFWC